MKIRVAAADDHEIFREGLQLLLSNIEGVELCGIAVDGDALIRLIQKELPNVVLTDIKMPIKGGVEVTKYITEHYTQIKVIALSMFDDQEQIIQFMAAGGKGYLLKDASKQETAEAIFAVANNKNYYSASITKKISEHLHGSKMSDESSSPSFKEIEVQIIDLICKGFTSKEIGEQIYLSARTIEGYKAKIMEKLNVKNSAGIIIYAIKSGLVK